MKRLAAAAMLVLFSASPVRAGLTGAELLKFCGSLVKETEGKQALNPEELTGAIFCAGYLVGFTDSRSVEEYGRKERLYCIPAGVDNGRLASVVTAYLKKHPEAAAESARVGVASALKEAFPCRAEKPKQ